LRGHIDCYQMMESNVSCTPLGNLDDDCLITNHRSIVMSSTQDSQDPPPRDDDVNVDIKESEEEDQVSLSVANTADIDNTHAYLVRSAERYSQEYENGSEMATVGTTTFVKVHKRRNRKSIIEDEEDNNFEVDMKERTELKEKSPRNGNSLLHFPSDEVIDKSYLTEKASSKSNGIQTESSTGATAIHDSTTGNAQAENNPFPPLKDPTPEKPGTETDNPQVLRNPDSSSLIQCNMITEGTQTEENLPTILCAKPEHELSKPKETLSTYSTTYLREPSAETKINGKEMAKVKHCSENHGDSEECVDFHTNPTPLFKYLYSEKWKLAQARLNSHPEDARVWVVRYFKRVGNGASDALEDRAIRWKLLPLHLFIALAGSSNYRCIEGSEDERDEIISDENAPPLQLLTSLLATYPEATTFPDDQGMIPLHSAIRGNSSLIIVEKILEANPSCIYCKDVKGRDAFFVTKRVYEKRRENQQEEGATRDMMYSKVYKLLTDASKLINDSSVERCDKMDYNPKQGKKMRRLQNEILALRRENALLRHRAINTDQMMREMQGKIHLLQQQLSSEIEKYNSLFGDEEDFNVRREMLLLSISQDSDEGMLTPTKESDSLPHDDDGGEIPESNTHIQEVPDTIQNRAGFATTNEKKHGLLGGGYYTKRLRRYHSLRNSSSIDGDFASPISTMTTETEATTPPSTPKRSTSSPFPKSTKPTTNPQECHHRIDCELRCRALELESFDEEDAMESAMQDPVIGGQNSVRGDGGRTAPSSANRDDNDTGKCSEGSISTHLVGSNANTIKESRSPFSNDIFRKQIVASVTNSDGIKSRPDDCINYDTRLDVTHRLDKDQGSKSGENNKAKQLDSNGTVKTITISEKKFSGIECESEYCDVVDEVSVKEGSQAKVDPLIYSIFGSYSMDCGEKTTENLLTADAFPTDDIFATADVFTTDDAEKPNSSPVGSIHSSTTDLEHNFQNHVMRLDGSEQSVFEGDYIFVDQADMKSQKNVETFERSSSPVTPPTRTNTDNLQFSESRSPSNGGAFETIWNSEYSAIFSPEQVGGGDVAFIAEDVSSFVTEKCHASYADAVKSSFASQSCHEKNQTKPNDGSNSVDETFIADDNEGILEHVGKEACDSSNSDLRDEGCEENYLEAAEESYPKDIAVLDVLPCAAAPLLSADSTDEKSSDEAAVNAEPPIAAAEQQITATATSNNECDTETRKVPTVATTASTSTGGFESGVASEIQRLRERFHLKD